MGRRELRRPMIDRSTSGDCRRARLVPCRVLAAACQDAGSGIGAGDRKRTPDIGFHSSTRPGVCSRSRRRDVDQGGRAFKFAYLTTDEMAFVIEMIVEIGVNAGELL